MPKQKRTVSKKGTKKVQKARKSLKSLPKYQTFIYQEKEARIAEALKAYHNPDNEDITTLPAVARAFGVPRLTLWNRNHGTKSLSENSGHNTRLNEAQEALLIWYSDMAIKRGFPLNYNMIITAATSILKATGKDISGDKERLGPNWAYKWVAKQSYLKVAILTTLLTAMVGTQEEPTYEEYCAQLRITSDQLDEVKEKKSGFERKWNNRTDVPTRAKSPAFDAIDWEPTTGVSAARTGLWEPRWASDDEIDRRRRKGLCLRCGDSNHKVRDCNAKLTAKTIPRTKPVRAALVEKRTKKRKSLIRAKKGGDDDDGDEEVATSSNEDSGKE
ncbi:hypothetical protein EG329_005294 [Mollisiaceae sp. DMI_Dod_QoI]|nr:hypothetical protein EG329_005294 [Helotiales sp. DMI_Dod_QoI]